MRPQIPTSPSKAHRHLGHLPRTSPSPFTPFSGCNCSPCSPSAHSRKPPRKAVWELSVGETPVFPCTVVPKGLWLRTSEPRKAHLPHPCGAGSSLPTALMSRGGGTSVSDRTPSGDIHLHGWVWDKTGSAQLPRALPLFPGRLFLRSCAFNCCAPPI